jgi:hypothetical protein
MFRRTYDSCLTPLGIWQARNVGKKIIDDIGINNNAKIILCASELNRSQHTSLELFHDLQTSQTQLGNIHNDLIQLKKLFAHMALRRLVRKLTENFLWRKGSKFLTKTSKYKKELRTIKTINNQTYYYELKKCINFLTNDTNEESTPDENNQNTNETRAVIKPNSHELMKLSIDILIQYCNDKDTQLYPDEYQKMDEYQKYEYIPIPITAHEKKLNKQ